MKRVLSLLLALIVLLSLCSCGVAPSSPVLAEAVYPSMAPRPRQEDYVKPNGWELKDSYFDAFGAWREDLQSFRSQTLGYNSALDPWFGGFIRQTLSCAGNENRVVSPLNVTMALAMLAEVTGKNTRQQILDLLGAEDLDTLRSTAHALWLQSYQDDGQTASILANAFWLAEGRSTKPKVLEALSSQYYASVFQGRMGSPEYDALLQSWINEQTGSLLQEEASGLHLDPLTVLALTSALYFKSPWVSGFWKDLTEPGYFYGPDGEQTVDYLFRTDELTVYWGERFTAIPLSMENGGAMWILLSDEGVTAEDLLNDPEAMAFLLLRDKSNWEKQRLMEVEIHMPKFDVRSNLDLVEGLQAMGVTDAFDPSLADFTPLTGNSDPLFVSKVAHAARVKIDEEGCEASAYTIIEAPASEPAPLEEKLVFFVDHPFLFCITNAGGLPLFTGLVNRPVA